MLLSTQTSNAVARLGFEGGVTVLHDAGYDCLDLSLFEMVRDDSVYVADNWRQTVEERRKFADEHGIIFNQSHAPFTFKWADDTVREEIAKPRIIRSLEIAAMMGVKTAIVHPLHWFEYKGHEAEARQMNLEYYRGLIPYCREYGIKVAVENMWQTEVKRKCTSDDVASHAADLASYIDEIDSEWIVACLDLGHCGLVGEEAEDAIRTLGADRLQALHVHDNDYLGDRHTLPGLGKMNWNAIMQALKDIGYRGELTYEADGFLKGFETDFFPQATAFMVQMGRYLLAKIGE